MEKYGHWLHKDNFFSSSTHMRIWQKEILCTAGEIEEKINATKPATNKQLKKR
jgi:hypothetical protein